jgi:hypothetical protein
MRDACIVTRGGTATFNESTGLWTSNGATTVYSGKCKLQTLNMRVLEPDIAGREGAIDDQQLHLPILGSEAVRRGDTVTMTACELDAAVVGKTFTVFGPHLGSAKTARRLTVKADVTSWP